jgi:hypothetical protein
VLYQGTFSYADLVQATDRNFYGVNYETGTYGDIFRVSTNGSYSDIFFFDNDNGKYPNSPLLQHTTGAFYGETYRGGPDDVGVFYSLDVGLKPFVSLVTTSGSAGETVGILGQGSQRTTNVAFNGTNANFKVVSGTFMTATVPRGATTGPVTVTTPTGTFTSNPIFRVLR